MSRYIDADVLPRHGKRGGLVHWKDIENAPTIEPKRGEWIDAEIRHEDGVLPIQVCSECKTFYPLEYTGGGHRFCPNCGARMYGEAKESE